MEEMTRSWERDGELAGSEGGGGVRGSVGDCDMLSEEQCASGDRVNAVAAVPAAGAGLGELVGCVDGRSLARGAAVVCCCSHIDCVWGSTGQLDVVSSVWGGGCGDACREGEGEGEGASTGASAFHHPMLLWMAAVSPIQVRTMSSSSS